MFVQEVYRLKTLLRIIGITILILAVHLYGKLLVSEYISQPSKTKDNKQLTQQKNGENYEGVVENISYLVGSEAEGLLAKWGEPARVEPSAYGYEWWIYNQDASHYVQFGVENHKVVTVYVAGEKVDISPLQLGAEYDAIYKQIPFSYEVSLEIGGNSYQFELSDEEVSEQPLIPVQEDVWAQLYFDRFTKELVGVRYMDNTTLVKHRPYQLVYSGELLEPPHLSEEQMKLVEQGNAQQILDLTNIIRARHDLPLLGWDQQTADVAYGHSKDMQKNEYFSHDSPKYGALGDRLQRGEVSFQLAGENIAAQHTDGIAAVHGWLNSEGHRENLLNEEFTNLGVGVYEKFYTQNFIQK